MALNEFEIIRRYFQRPPQQPSVACAVGDDCAVLSVPAEQQLVVSMDTLVAGRHFPSTAAPDEIASRAFCTALSDLAAMGAEPLWFTLGLTLPQADSDWLQRFAEGLFAVASPYNCDLVGGDTTRGPLTVTVQVHGAVPEGCALMRSGATVGDTVFVTETLGDGAAALAVLLGDATVDPQQRDYLQRRFYRPQPQIAAGLAIRNLASSAIDISDGLLADLNHIAVASQVDIEVDAGTLPISPACRATAGNERQALAYACQGGDDYQLAFTVPLQNVAMIERMLAAGALSATAIGSVQTCRAEPPQVRCYHQGETLAFNEPGYQHFVT